jgi:hypothetical protein
MEEPVIVQTAIKSRGRLEDMYDFTANFTIGLADGGDFYLVLDFLNLTEKELEVLAQLSKLPRRISIFHT